MIKTNLFKRGLSLFTATTLMAGLLVCGTAVKEPVTAEAATTKNIAAPVQSFVLDFETATPGDYTKSASVTDGKGLKYNVSTLEDASATVMNDPTGKFNGSTVLRLNPLTTTLNSAKEVGFLVPENLTTPDGKDYAFATKDSNGTRSNHGYRMHYSYDYYISFETDSKGNVSQDLLWRTNTTANGGGDTVLIGSRYGMHAANATKTTSSVQGTHGWHEGTWQYKDHDEVIHMDYVVDFETGEIWMYRNGKLYQTRDFSEVPRSYFINEYQSLQDCNNVKLRFRQKNITATDKTYICYDNFKVDMYGSNVSAKLLREMVSESTIDHAGSAITHQASADFESAANLTDGTNYQGTNLATVASKDSGAADINQTLENGRLKVERAQTTKRGYLNINFTDFNLFADISSKSLDLPKNSSSKVTMNGTNAIVDENFGIRYLRFGYDRMDGSKYDVQPIEYADYIGFSADIEPGKDNAKQVSFTAYYAQADGRTSSETDLYAGEKGLGNKSFIGFDITSGEKVIRAFNGEKTGYAWAEGKSYHVDYLVNLQTGDQITILDGVVIARETDATIPQRGTIPRIRGWFTQSENLDSFYLDNVEFTLYNELNTSFEALEKKMAYAATIENLAGQLVGSDVKVTAKLGGDATKYENAKIITALYQNYGEANAKMLDAAISNYEGEDDAFAATLDAGNATGTLLVKMFIWSMNGLTPLCEAEESQAVATSVTAVYPNNTMKALTIGFDDCNDAANNYVLSAMADYSEGLKKKLSASFNVIGNQISNLTGDYTGMDIITHGQTHPNHSATDVVLPTEDSFWIDEYRDGLNSVKTWVNGVSDGTHGTVGKGLVYSNNKPAPASCTAYYAWLKSAASGISFARGSGTRIYPGFKSFDAAFTMPSDWYSWKPTCTGTSNFIYTADNDYVTLTNDGESDIEKLKTAYLKSRTVFDEFADSSYQPEGLRVFFTWAHPSSIYSDSTSDAKNVSNSTSYKAHSGWNWELLMNAYVEKENEVWMANQTEFYDYVTAVNNLYFAGTKLVNDADVDVYVRLNGALEATKIPAKGSIDVAI